MFQKICNVLSGIILAVLVLIAAALLVPNLLGYKSLAVLSGSMEPEIPVGSIVYAKGVDAGELAVGDVITYRLNGDTLVTHRIEEIDPESQEIITKGDANENSDGAPVSFSSIVGRVAFHLPFLDRKSVV